MSSKVLYVPALDADFAGSLAIKCVSIGLINHLGSHLMHKDIRVRSSISSTDGEAFERPVKAECIEFEAADKKQSDDLHRVR